MSTATLPGDARRNVALFSSFSVQGTVRKFRSVNADGQTVLNLQGVPVFRSGTFRDSMGIQHTWEDMHMQQMVDNFNHLIKTGIMEGAPVRKGHSGFFSDGSAIMDSLIGWHSGLSTEERINPVDGQRYTYLLADFQILDPTAQDKIDSGLWKSLSSEVGTWTSNNEAEYWPVYQGVAYVDFPAVEGLKTFASANGVGSKFSIMSEENAVPDAPQNQQTPATPPLPPAPPGTTPAGQQQTADHGAGQQTQTQAPANGPVQTPFQFTVAGRQVTDFAAVQAHINSLEEFRSETVKGARVAFVSGLVSSNKMLATNKEKAEAFCLGLSDEQFTAYKEQWENAPVLPQLGNHAAGTTNHTGQTPAGSNGDLHDPANAQNDEKKVLEDTISAFRISGMSEEQIKKTKTFSRLQQLQSAAAA